MTELEQIKDNLYDILSLVADDNLDKYNDGCKLVDDIDTYWKEDRIKLKNKMNEKLNLLNQTNIQLETQLNNTQHVLEKQKQVIDNLKQELDDDDKQMEQLEINSKMFRYLALFRQTLNVLFNKYWFIHQNNISNLNPTIDYEQLILDTPIFSRKYISSKDPGIKYALCIINDLYTGTPKDLCELYIRLNDKFHPKIKPINLVKQSINECKQMMLTYIPPLCQQIGLTNRTLCELEQEINNNESIFN